jgi:hypothetical protein
MERCLFFLSLVLLRIDPAAGQDVDTLRVYFVGNSVTDTIKYRALGELQRMHGWGMPLSGVSAGHFTGIF